MDHIMRLHHGMEASYKVEPLENKNEISINLNSYDGDFELADISELIESFKKDSGNIKLNNKEE